jgi:hypothetical protein
MKQDPRSNPLVIRQTLAENVAEILTRVVSFREDSKNDTEDLFADFTEQKSANKLHLEPTPNFSELEALLKEKEFLGLYVTNNPIHRFTPFLAYVREVLDRQDVYLILIDKVKKIYTKSKDMMFALEISIDEQKCEGVIFSKNATRLSSVLEEHQVFWVKGKISDRSKKKQDKPAPVVVEQIVDQDLEGGEALEGVLVSENEIREFVELPKLIIDEISPFNNGVVGLFDNDKIGLNMNVKTRIMDINYAQIMLAPESYMQIIDGLEDGEEVAPVKEYKELKVLQTMKKENAMELKKILTLAQEKGGHTRNIICSLLIQLPNQTFQKSSQEYPLNPQEYSLVLGLL